MFFANFSCSFYQNCWRIPAIRFLINFFSLKENLQKNACNDGKTKISIFLLVFRCTQVFCFAFTSNLLLLWCQSTVFFVQALFVYPLAIVHLVLEAWLVEISKTENSIDIWQWLNFDHHYWLDYIHHHPNPQMCTCKIASVKITASFKPYVGFLEYQKSQSLPFVTFFEDCKLHSYQNCYLD